MASQRLLSFAGRCPIKQATPATQRAAHQAAYLAQWRALAVTPARRTLTERQRRWLTRLLGVLFMAILGTALYPGDEPTRPLRVAEEAPGSRVAWHESDYHP